MYPMNPWVICYRLEILFYSCLDSAKVAERWDHVFQDMAKITVNHENMKKPRTYNEKQVE